MSSFYVENFGCRATQADGAAIEQQFQQRGLDRASQPSAADWVVLNTCAVTAAAEQDARAAIRRLRRQNPHGKIVITGCYAQRAPEELAALPGVSHVIGNSHKHTLAQIAIDRRSETDVSRDFIPLSTLQPNLVANELGNAEIFVSDIFAHTELMAAPVFESANERTRPNLKIQDGCNNRCSFCIIPSLRGRSRSLPTDRVIEEVNQLAASGYREVVLSGINLGRWGRDLSRVPHFSPTLGEVGSSHSTKTNFEDLIRFILSNTSIEKLRISSVEPMDWTDSLIRLVADLPRIAKHAHVPMQSGSDAVLRRMHRKYRPWHYREKIEKIHAAMPTAAIGADVMVGFPGESDAEFDETRRMIEDLPFTYLHVFTFSARPGTPAATMPKQVPVQVARERNRILRELAVHKKLAFMRSFVGKQLEAITLNVTSEDEDGPWTEALTDNYLRLRLRGNWRPNHWIKATIADVIDGQLIATASLPPQHSAETPAAVTSSVGAADLSPAL